MFARLARAHARLSSQTRLDTHRNNPKQRRSRIAMSFEPPSRP
jgi:hypothetical protein